MSALTLALIILAVILFGIATFAPGVRSGRCIPGGLFCLALAQLIGTGVIG